MSAEGKVDAPAQDSESDADSCTKSGSPGSYEELNSQTQRVLRGDLDFAFTHLGCRVCIHVIYSFHIMQMVLSVTQ